VVQVSLEYQNPACVGILAFRYTPLSATVYCAKTCLVRTLDRGTDKVIAHTQAMLRNGYVYYPLTTKGITKNPDKQTQSDDRPSANVHAAACHAYLQQQLVHFAMDGPLREMKPY
jgi:hypothetical protein